MPISGPSGKFTPKPRRAGYVFIQRPRFRVHGRQVLPSLLGCNDLQRSVFQLDDHAGARQHFETLFPDVLVRMTDELAMAAGELPLVARQKGVIKADARSGPKGVWLDGVQYQVLHELVKVFKTLLVFCHFLNLFICYCQARSVGSLFVPYLNTWFTSSLLC